jgi:hypothetical protein
MSRTLAESWRSGAVKFGLTGLIRALAVKSLYLLGNARAVIMMGN